MSLAIESDKVHESNDHNCRFSVPKDVCDSVELLKSTCKSCTSADGGIITITMGYDVYRKMLQSALVITFFLRYLAAYSTCNAADVKSVIKVPIKKLLSATAIEISGNIEIRDGCTVIIYSV